MSQLDEETPLLRPEEQVKIKTPLPWRQLSIILFLQLTEPVTAQAIAPFAPQLIRDIGVTHGDESRVAYFVGIMYSVFYVAQALTTLQWNRLSDHVGRKPVILTGLFGISISMFLFGLSKTFGGLILSRVLCGALNGNGGVIKSMMIDVTDSSNMAQAYGFLPIPWMTGNALGPLIGGSLSHPADRFPRLFGQSTFLKTYPYFLACAGPALFTAFTWLVTYMLLQETVPTTTTLWSLVRNKCQALVHTKPPQPDRSNSDMVQGSSDDSRPLPLSALMTPRVLIVTLNYGTLALLDIALRTLIPVFYSTPVNMGGLGLDPPRIGNILAVFGIANGLIQVFFFARLHDRFGTKLVYTCGVASSVPTIIAFPTINMLSRTYGIGAAVWFAVGLQLTMSIALNMCYACAAMYIAASSPNRASLGATNGVAHTVAACVRIIGPASAMSMFSFSVRDPYCAWAVYYFMMMLGLLAIGVSFLLPRRMWTRGS
ncbi:major facilitator superfamily domain-containing protein [Suillus fuscotomentosus]|uniref:Major facilitator superfamily domain-containing protein n=1 Tax=Suillus fuscotomentosus TaxID=1912939 RepID=A0AAD4HKX8_9AGAM|nr:major facilitator superfamily domain-containing protein [Suillus fuscotomentosus]KAG1901470.1 major facilitator superfamily domain-containing protein [Suillus fuscotomentosus]